VLPDPRPSERRSRWEGTVERVVEPVSIRPDDPKVEQSPLPSESAGAWTWASSWASSLTWTVALMLGTTLLFGAGLATTDLWAPDEPRYAAIAEELREMRHGVSGLVLLHLNDTVYTQKPPLYFWLAALAGTPGSHVSEFAARLPSALAGLLGVALTLWIGRRLIPGRFVPLLAGGILATSFRFVFTARRAQLDVLLTTLELFAIACFLFLDARRSAAPSRRDILALVGLHSALGLAALTKGPAGWLPLAVIAAFLSWEGRTRSLRRLIPAWSLLLSVAPLVAWVSASTLLAPEGYFQTAVVDNVFGRIVEGTSHARPIYYYLYQLPLNFLPWGLALPLTLLWLGAHRRKAPLAQTVSPESVRFLICWIALPLIVFSLSAGKRAGYLLPVFPALALATAAALVAYLGGSQPKPAAKRLALAIAGIAALELVLLVGVAPRLNASKSPRPIAASLAGHNNAVRGIGLYDLSPLEGGLLYYGAGPIERLDGLKALESFQREGGEVVLMRARHAVELGDRYALRTIDSFRAGDRALKLVAFVRDTHESTAFSGHPAGQSHLAVKPAEQPR